MARYIGPKNKINRKFGEPVLGSGKDLSKNSNPPGMHGGTRKRKSLSEYGIQLKEKQKAKYTYLVLEKQFLNTYKEANRQKGSTGANLIKLLESRLDNVIFRMGLAPTRSAARQLVSHKHILVNGESVNVPSYLLKAGDAIELKPKSKLNQALIALVRPKNHAFTWLEVNDKEFKGTFITTPERENVPENIQEALIVELYSR